MVLTLWEENGTIKETAAGVLIECETCPCVTGCSVCDPGTTPGSITVTFGAGTDLGGDGSECVGDCDDFDSLGPWELQQLSQAQVDALFITCPIAFTTGGPAPVAGCYYGLTDGLPCGCVSMILEIIDGGTAGAGLATGNVTMCWTSTKWARVSWEINTADTDQDCLTNIDTAGGGVDNISGVGNSATLPECDFNGLNFDFTLLDLTANA